MEQHPDRGSRSEATARDLAAMGRHDEAALVWSALAAERPAGAPRADALIEQARCTADPAAAALLWRRALANDPAREPALEALSRHATAQQQWLLLANLLRLRFQQATDATEKSKLALEAGRLELERLHSPGAALSWFRDGLECDPDQIEIVSALVELERRRGDDATLLVGLERLIELRGDDAAASELLEAATLRSARGEMARALAHLERASTRAPDDALVLDALADVLASLDRSTELADVLERRAVLAADDPDVRAGVLMELGALHEERLFDPEAALDAYQRAARDDPRAPALRDAITRLRAKLDADGGEPPPSALTDAPAPVDRADDALHDLEREVRTTNDRTRLGLLVREIETLHRRRGTPDEALPFVKRWASAAPEDPEALRALARLHDQPGHEAELTATLETLDPLLEPAEQVGNRRRLASVYRQWGRLDDAVRSYERALALEPRQVDVLESLATLLRERGDEAERVRVLQRLVDLRDRRQRAAGLVEIAETQESLGAITDAIATRQQLEHEELAPPDSDDRLDTLLEVAERHEELEGRLRRRREGCDPGSAEWVAIELRRAQILSERLDRPEDAADAFRAVLVHAPESPEAKSGLERSLRASIDAEGLVAFLAEQASDASDPAARDRAALERAVLLDEVLERTDEARETYRALAHEGHDDDLRTEASSRYERLLQRSDEWEALRDHLERRLSQTGPAERGTLHERLASICAESLQDPAGELSHWEALVALEPSRSDVWRILAERYEQADRVDDQIHAMEQELAIGCDVARSLTLHARLAELYLTARGDAPAARQHYERVFELDPSHAAAARYLIGRYDEDRRPEDLIRVLEARLASLGPAGSEGSQPGRAQEVVSHRTALRVHIAHVRAAKLDDVEGAISALEVALGEAGPRPQIAEPLAACYQRAGYMQDLIELSRSAASACDEPGEAANWYVRMGDAFLARERPREAADAFRQALTERPDDRAVQASLRAIYRRLGEVAPLVGLLDAELTHLAGVDEVPVRMELARLQSDALDRGADALLHVQRVLELVPRHPEAFALAMRLTEQQGRHEVALDLVETRIEYARDAAERALLLDRRAALLAGPFGQPDDAIESMRASLAMAPDDARRQQLADLLAREGRHAEWLDVIGEQARDAVPAERIALLERAVGVAWEKLSPDDALPWLERLAALRRDDVEVLLRIAHAHRSARRTESLLHTLGRALERTTNPVQRRNLQLERAALLELELASPGRALIALEDARRCAPDDPEVLGRLERLQAALSRHEERAETLERLRVASPEDAIDLHRELARLRADALHDPAGAIRHWEAALESAHPDDPVRIEVLHALADTQRRAGDLERWAETAERELATLGAAPVFDDRRREIRRELLLAYAGPLARPTEALRHGRALLDAGEDELLGNENLGRIESIVLALLREAGAPVELESRLTRHLARRPENAERWLELARLREEDLQATAAAIDAYRRCLELDPENLPALRGLRAAAERLGRFEDVADALERELEHPDSEAPEIRGSLLRRLGDVYWHRLQSTTRASRHYAAALEVDGADFTALRALERLLEAMEDWRGALDLCESEVEVLGDADPNRRRELWLHVATLARERTDDVERARRALLHAAAIAPLEPAPLRELADLHECAGDTAAFAESFAAWCEADGVEPEPADWLRLSQALGRLDRPGEALEYALRAVSEETRTPDAWDEAATLRERTGDRAGAAAALREAARWVADREAAERLQRGAGLVAEEDPEEALALLREAVARDPGATSAHAERARLALRTGALAEAEEAAAAALDPDSGDSLSDRERLEVALLGGDAARAAARLEVAAGFYGRARAVDETVAAASGRYGEVLAELGDTTHARDALESRLALGDAYPERASHRATLATCLETDGEEDGALEAALAALDDDPAHEIALGVCVRMYESQGRVDEAVDHMLRWAAVAGDAATRARRLLRCAEWEMRSGEREREAERHARDALAADPKLIPAWVLIASMLLGQGRLAEAIECTDRAAPHAEHEDLGTLALIQGRAYEQQADRTRAAEAFGLAAEADPHCSEGALSQARLLRGAGEWRAAGRALESFLERHPSPDDEDLAAIHEQRARLLAGPLEDVEGAVTHYRRAIALAPGPLAPRAALAELLSHRSGDRDEALALVRSLLAENPCDPSTLRVALRLARARDAGAGVAIGIEVLRALGLGSAYELDEAGSPAALSTSDGLAPPVFERLREVATLAADAIAQALQASARNGGDDDTQPESPEARFRAARLRIEGELAAPALVPLPNAEVAEVLTLVVRLAVDPDTVRGDGRRVNELSEALRRRQRRRLRKEIGADADALCGIDFAQWRVELRALAASRAIAEVGCSLRTALICLARDEVESLDDEVRDGANVAACVAESAVARALLRRIVGDWLERT